jgi:hypothetical protein
MRYTTAITPEQVASAKKEIEEMKIKAAKEIKALEIKNKKTV